MGLESNSGPLSILIVGAGIGGLTAAIGLRKQGHNVTLFERSSLATETGAAVHLAPNCNGILRRFGIFAEKFGANRVQGIIEYDGKGILKADINLTQANKMWQHPWLLSHRVSLHNKLKEEATSTTGMGPPAKLVTSSQVTSIDTAEPSITLSDGQIIKGDLVLGADGVGSVTRKHVVGRDIKPFSSGKSAFRFLIPRDVVEKNKATAHLIEREGYMLLWHGTDRRLVMYPCSDNTLMNFVAIHPSDLSPSKDEGWNGAGSKTKLLEIFKNFGETVQALLSLADEDSLNVWTLLDMDRIPRWVEGRVALLGDAAHPFLPYQGQGGGIAIEDAASLAALFPKGVTSDEIPERLKLYEQLRDDRAHKIQHFTRLTGKDLAESGPEEFNAREFSAYNYGHDEWDHSSHALRKWLSQRHGPAHRRIPLAWGNLPSPRQDHLGRQIPAEHSTFVTHSVRFRTSATLLRTLFPTEAFRFLSPATVVEASFKCTKVDKLDWLGGGGYNFFGLWIHGVQFQKKNGNTIKGDFLPLLLENLADPILTGREELGMPKLFSDIAISDQDTTRTIACSWRGKEFIKIEMNGLKEAEVSATNGTPANQSSEGAPKPPTTLTYRYVPSVGNPGVADAAYTVAIDPATSRVPSQVERTLQGTSSTVTCSAGDWKTLPTLHNVAAGLAEIPVYEVLETKIVEGRGVDDLFQARKVE